MNSPPRIGITMYGRDEENRFALPAEYSEAVQRAGGMPLLLPPLSPEAAQDGAGVVATLRAVDGLILAGGGDIAPEHYGGQAHETVYMLDPDRDRFELELARAVLASDKPILAICRGIQILNVALGGTLIEHLPDVVGDRVAHRLPPREPTPHSVSLVADSELAATLGATEVEAMSWHHQALRDVAPDLRVVARAPDGTIEAIERSESSWCFGVQWHPELTAATDASQQRLFEAHVSAARRFMDASAGLV